MIDGKLKHVAAKIITGLKYRNTDVIRKSSKPIAIDIYVCDLATMRV